MWGANAWFVFEQYQLSRHRHIRDITTAVIERLSVTHPAKLVIVTDLSSIYAMMDVEDNEDGGFFYQSRSSGLNIATYTMKHFRSFLYKK